MATESEDVAPTLAKLNVQDPDESGTQEVKKRPTARGSKSSRAAKPFNEDAPITSRLAIHSRTSPFMSKKASFKRRNADKSESERRMARIHDGTHFNFPDELKEYEGAIVKAREEMHKVSLSDLAEKGSGLRDKGVELRDNMDPHAALMCHLRALACHESAYGINDYEVARDLGNMGNCFCDMAYGDPEDESSFKYHKFEQALAVFEEALHIDEKAYGPNHLEVANDLGSMGIVFSVAGLNHRAVPYLHKSFSIMEDILEPDHPNRTSIEDFLQDAMKKQYAMRD